MQKSNQASRILPLQNHQIAEPNLSDITFPYAAFLLRLLPSISPSTTPELRRAQRIFRHHHEVLEHLRDGNEKGQSVLPCLLLSSCEEDIWGVRGGGIDLDFVVVACGWVSEGLGDGWRVGSCTMHVCSYVVQCCCCVAE
jgi:hypothetical protein